MLKPRPNSAKPKPKPNRPRASFLHFFGQGLPQKIPEGTDIVAAVVELVGFRV